MKIWLATEYGSTNYGLDGPESDHDYKLIAVPDFDDLYHGRNLSEKQYLPAEYDPEHYSTLDIRQWNRLLKDGNINAIEYLFSQNVKPLNLIHSEGLYAWRILAQVYYQEGYAREVWPTVFSSAKGVVLNSLKRYGPTPKTVSRACYYYELLRHIAQNDFKINKDIWKKHEVIDMAWTIRFDHESWDDYLELYDEEFFKNVFCELENSIEQPQSFKYCYEDVNKQLYYAIKDRVEGERFV